MKLVPAKAGNGNPELPVTSMDSGSSLRFARNDRIGGIIYNKTTTKHFIMFRNWGKCERRMSGCGISQLKVAEGNRNHCEVDEPGGVDLF